jgi:hypothetical protein
VALSGALRLARLLLALRLRLPALLLVLAHLLVQLLALLGCARVGRRFE